MHNIAPILEVRDITVRFGGFTALNGVNLSIAPGELRVLIGANGAGKSTLLDVLCGKTRPTSGSIRFAGKDITHKSEPAIARTGVGRKFQAPTIFEELTVRQNLEIARNSCFSIVGNVFSNIRRSGDREMDKVLAHVGLEDRAEYPASVLSHGQRQWLELGMLLMQNAQLVLLDEPTAGMTASETARTAEILRGLEGSHSVIVVEHDMAFVRDIARTITVLHLGRVLAEGDAVTVQNDPKVIDVYLGTAQDA